MYSKHPLNKEIQYMKQHHPFILVILLLFLPLPYLHTLCVQTETIYPGPADCSTTIKATVGFHILYSQFIEHRQPFNYFAYYGIPYWSIAVWIVIIIALTILLGIGYEKIRKKRVRE